MGFHSQEWRLTGSVTKPKFKPSSTDHPTFNRIIHSLSSPNNWVAMTNPPTILILWLVKRQHQIYDFDIKPCHLIRKTLFDWQKRWLQRTRQFFSSWMRCSIRTGKLISFLKESCFSCDFHWFGLVNKIFVWRLVFREVLRVLWDWFAALTKRIKRATKKQGGGFFDLFLAFYGKLSILIWFFFQIWWKNIIVFSFQVTY